MRLNKGFTFIELIVVIVISGIIAVTAMPRLMDFKQDSVVASMETLKGGIDSAANIRYRPAPSIGQLPITSLVTSGC